METGAYMKFYERNTSGERPRLKDAVSFEMNQYFRDTLIFSTVGDKPIEIELEPASFEGDVTDALLMMRVGDSVRLAVLADSVFVRLMNIEVPEEYAGKPIFYDIKLLSIKPFEEIEAERRDRAEQLRAEEQAYLDALLKGGNCTLSESGLIVLDKKGNGTLARMGDYVNFDFSLRTKDGDTLMSTYGIRPIIIQYGEEFVCDGLVKAIGMVPKGGTMRFVIPSELGFDSLGYQGIVEPYAPLEIDMKMNDIMDKETHDRKLAEMEAEKEAEKERMQVIENEAIRNYLLANGIKETPTESGLYIIRKEEGKGNVAQWGDKVFVHYIMKNLKGEQVESSYEYEEPMSFTIGQGEMIDAIEEAVLTMAPGAKVTLISPSGLAFGNYAVHEKLLPAYSPVLIELELVSIE